MADGKFDNLKGRGKPLDLKRYSEIPEHLRPAYHILKNAGFVILSIPICFSFPTDLISYKLA
jgi:hypothetical protein